MSRQERGHWDPDGYKELERQKMDENRDAKPIRNKELRDLKNKEYANKKKSSRAGKLIHPKGAGRRTRGENL
jgi:hypothetical protein